jgi:hypothetical protein
MCKAFDQCRAPGPDCLAADQELGLKLAQADPESDSYDFCGE